ncbi:TIGR00730 family Rossman fold protein [bacterium]|nr:TIGR00730 family Rossman fold protein [bacterium]
MPGRCFSERSFTVPLSICVYCASSSAIPQAYVAAARELGEAISLRKHTLVYGGGKVGLMGTVAQACLDGGARVIGVIPEVLKARELAMETVDELIVTRDMHQRKATMAARADGFIALPGGFGTFEEILETITHRLLGLHQKTCVILNINNYYRPLLEQFDQALQQGFACKEFLGHYLVAQTPNEALDLIEQETARLAPKN